MSRNVVLCLVAGRLALAPLANTQAVTGSVTGTVVDPASAVVAGAEVKLINNISGQSREFTTNAIGGFEFTSLIPGVYSLKVTRAGFNTYAQQNVTVSAQERVDLHTIKLTVGYSAQQC